MLINTRLKRARGIRNWTRRRIRNVRKALRLKNKDRS